MAKCRNIPFGYAIQNGEFIPHPTESKVVQEIFGRYLDGQSYKTISESLTTGEVPYQANRPDWDKNMVKRIIENRRYIGTELYPPLISESKYLSAQKLKSGKIGETVKHSTDESNALLQKAYCGECGAKVHRHQFNKNREKWYCSVCADIESRITDCLLIQSITEIFQRIAEYTTSVIQETPPSYEPDLTVTRLHNELNRELEKPTADSDKVKSLIMQSAAAKYDCCTMGNARENRLLQTLFQTYTQTEELNIPLFRKTVRKLFISKGGLVSIQMINGKTLQ